MKSLENWHEYSPLGHAKVLLLHIYSMLPLITLRMAHRLSIIMANTLGSIVCGPVPDGPGFWKPAKTFIIIIILYKFFSNNFAEKSNLWTPQAFYDHDQHLGVYGTWTCPRWSWPLETN